MSKFILPFSKISAKDIKIAGGKGASLGEMAGAKIPVPGGFIILAGAFDYFLSAKSRTETAEVGLEIKTELSKINFNDINSIDRASNIIRDIIDDTKIPQDLMNEIKTEFKKLKAKSVAVRSSATAEDSKVASWAGELETYLNTTEKALLKNIKKCWSSLYTPRAIFYRYEKNLIDQKVSVAVVVQKMIQSEISGVCFTVHPVTKDENQMIIEAGYGLGEALVSGQITPDSYVVGKSKVKSLKSKVSEEFDILDINIAEQEKMLVRKNSTRHGIVWKPVSKTKQEKQKLTNKQIIELAKICCQIERHYGFPCDIEWAFEKRKFYITQSRPITTL